MINSYRFYHTNIGTRPVSGSARIRFGKELETTGVVEEWAMVVFPGVLELYLVHSRVMAAASSELWLQLQRAGLVPPAAAPVGSDVNEGEAAIARFLEVASGTSDIAGGGNRAARLQEAYQAACSNGYAGPVLHRLFQRGIWLHEKVRQETEFFQLAIEQEAVISELVGKIRGSAGKTHFCFFGPLQYAAAIAVELRKKGHTSFSFWTEDPDGAPVRGLGTVNHRSAGDPLPVRGEVFVFLPDGKDSHDEAQLLDALRTRRQALIVFDLSGSSDRHRHLKRLGQIYCYSTVDLENVISANMEGRRHCAREIGKWIQGESRELQNWQAAGSHSEFAGIVGASAGMQRVFELVTRIARTDITVLIDGESGTGKERVARAIHEYSRRADRPFSVINCGAIPENLLESELFGHERGAFTGAVAQKKGLLEIADGGTLLLDEVGELPAHLQVKLLRFLQEGEIKRVGSNDTCRVDVRILAATNQQLAGMVQEKRFRSDLYYRLNVIQLTVPPLRTRRTDVPLLADFFARKYAGIMSKPVASLSSAAVKALMDYSWPGNVRELENAIERAVALSLGEQIELYNLPPAILEPAEEKHLSGSINGEARLTLKQMERQYILATLESCDGNYDLASRLLGIGRTTLWRKLREYNIAGE